MSHNIETVTQERWNQAQEAELRCWINEPQDSDDWNLWWANQFSNYQFLEGRKIDSIYEVGCGPYAKNIELICKKLGYFPKRILLEDPLLGNYLKLGKSVSRFKNMNATFIDRPMEDFLISEINQSQVDLLICNNVLDHVRSVEMCFNHMNSALKSGGILIFGQDLTSIEDIQKHGDINDPCHPIRIDESALNHHLSQFEPIFQKKLQRHEGRNPEYHYATSIFAGIKK